MVTRLGLAAGAASALVADPADWAFAADQAREIMQPVKIVQTEEFEELEYDGPPYRGLRADLNGDGTPEYIVQSAPSLCGNGGCVFALFDGASLRPLGLVFGGWMVVRAAPSGYFPIIHALSHQSADSASYTTFSYDGMHYVRLTSIHLDGLALAQLVQELKQIPMR